MTVEEMEQPAKQWQVEAVNVQLKAMDANINSKMDQLLKGSEAYATKEELLEVKKDAREYTDAKFKEVAPFIKIFWAVITAVIVAAVLMYFQLKG